MYKGYTKFKTRCYSEKNINKSEIASFSSSNLDILNFVNIFLLGIQDLKEFLFYLESIPIIMRQTY